MTVMHQQMNVSAIIARLAELNQDYRKSYGDLDHTFQIVSTLMFDVLSALGIPENGVQMVLSQEKLPISQAVNSLHCCFCSERATHIVQGKEYLLVCARHAREGVNAGFRLVASTEVLPHHFPAVEPAKG